MEKQYTLAGGFSAMDFDAITALLQTAYWCPDIQKEEVMLGAENSAVVVGAFDTTGAQIGYARVVSDKVKLGYIMDVIVDERYRKQGIASEMMHFLLDHPDLRKINHWLLSTKDAHPLYRKLGFDNLKYPEIMMEWWKK
jgi:ribosomal protein S18 acetylase RimI-like enzyme